MRALKLFAAYLAVMLVGALFGAVGHVLGVIGAAASAAHDAHAWIWNMESALAMFMGLCLFFAPIVYDIFVEQPKNIT